MFNCKLGNRYSRARGLLVRLLPPEPWNSSEIPRQAELSAEEAHFAPIPIYTNASERSSISTAPSEETISPDQRQSSVLCGQGATRAQDSASTAQSNVASPLDQGQLPVVRFKGPSYVLASVARSNEAFISDQRQFSDLSGQGLSSAQVATATSITEQTPSSLQATVATKSLTRRLPSIQGPGKRIYVFGSYNKTEKERQKVSGISVEYYDCEKKMWERARSMPNRREGFSVAAFQNSIWIAGGFKGQFLSTVDIYEPSTNSWRQGPRMTMKRGAPGLVEYGDKLIALGGATLQNSILSYQSSTEAVFEQVWTPGVPMTTIRCAMGVAVARNRIYVVGGDNLTSDHPTVEFYHPVSKIWISISPPSPKKANFSQMVVCDELMYVFTAECNRSCFVYNPFVHPDGEWKRIMKNRKSITKGSAVAVVDRHVYVIGGVVGGRTIRNVSKYDMDNGRPTWEMWSSRCIHQRAGAKAVVVSDNRPTDETQVAHAAPSSHQVQFSSCSREEASSAQTVGSISSREGPLPPDQGQVSRCPEEVHSARMPSSPSLSERTGLSSSDREKFTENMDGTCQLCHILPSLNLEQVPESSGEEAHSGQILVSTSLPEDKVADHRPTDKSCAQVIDSHHQEHFPGCSREEASSAQTVSSISPREEPLPPDQGQVSKCPEEMHSAQMPSSPSSLSERTGLSSSDREKCTENMDGTCQLCHILPSLNLGQVPESSREEAHSGQILVSTSLPEDKFANHRPTDKSCAQVIDSHHQEHFPGCSREEASSEEIVDSISPLEEPLPPDQGQVPECSGQETHSA